MEVGPTTQRFRVLVPFILFFGGLHAQSDSTGAKGAATSSLSFEAYVEAYFAFDMNEPAGYDIPYFVTYTRHNEFNINIACLTARYTADRVRGVFTPGFGTYMNANYAAERTTLENLVEASVGVKVFREKNIWLDAGVLPSPFTNEAVIAIDQPTLTRAIGTENVPYYLSGARLTLPLGSRWNLYAYLVNGWQEIQDVNAPLACASWLEFKVNKKLSLHWNNFLGNEGSAAKPTYRLRFFTDAYALWRPSQQWSFTASAYAGWQEKRAEEGLRTLNWWQANASAKYWTGAGHAFYTRVERFDDPNSVLVSPITGTMGYQVTSATIGHERNITDQVKFRMEARGFWADGRVYRRDGMAETDGLTFIGGLIARFK